MIPPRGMKNETCRQNLVTIFFNELNFGGLIYYICSGVILKYL